MGIFLIINRAVKDKKSGMGMTKKNFAAICGWGDGFSGVNTIGECISGSTGSNRAVNRATQAFNNSSWTCCQPIYYFHGWTHKWFGCTGGGYCDENCEKHRQHGSNCCLHHSSAKHWHLWSFWWGEPIICMCTPTSHPWATITCKQLFLRSYVSSIRYVISFYLQ